MIRYKLIMFSDLTIRFILDRFGPNGGLVFCMEFLMENISWLEKQLNGTVQDEDDV